MAFGQPWLGNTLSASTNESSGWQQEATGIDHGKGRTALGVIIARGHETLRIIAGSFMANKLM
ncbi:ABC transporter substrate-binding protein [Sesbania bispinosa]|nr:ABC transporter substrate-binding protein [Sesbania bispinosa]